MVAAVVNLVDVRVRFHELDHASTGADWLLLARWPRIARARVHGTPLLLPGAIDIPSGGTHVVLARSLGEHAVQHGLAVLIVVIRIVGIAICAAGGRHGHCD